MNELIDEACGRVLQTIARRGWLADTDVIFTTDHGEMQGDFGLLYKGPYHTDALMRLPFVWRPAPSAGIVPAVVHDPVGQVDLAPTFCAIAGVDPAPWMQGRALPPADGEARARAGAVRVGQPVPRLRDAPALRLPRRVALHGLRAVHGRAAQRAGGDLGRRRPAARARSCTSSRGPVPAAWRIATGELYDVEADPYQFENRWDDPSRRAQRDDLVADLYASLPSEVRTLKVVAPA